MKQKLIFLDIDGTITMPGTPPSRETVESIRAARKKGNSVFLCTGRSAFFIDPAVAEIGYDGGIYHAGGRVILGGKELVNAPMAQDKTLRLIELLKQASVTFHLEAASGLYTHEVPQTWEIEGISQASSEMLRQIQQRRMLRSLKLTDYAGEPIYKISFMAYHKEQKEFLTDHLPDWAKLVWFENMLPDLPALSGEISHKFITKATAMEAICRALGASAADCIAFGDSMNDAEILEAAGIGIAMGNSPAEVKAIADQVCESCNDDGIAKTLHRMGLC